MEQQSYLSDIEFNPVFATTGQRFLNYLIDLIIFDIIITVIKEIFSIGFNTFYNPNPYYVAFLNLLINYAFFVVFYFASELAFKGRTIGKFITGTKAVNEDGTEMIPKTVLLRTLSRIVPFEPFSAFGGHPWHDKWTRTHVIDVKKTEQQNVAFLQ
jgi:uncharacterized RDD family membrane protein YckC